MRRYTIDDPLPHCCVYFKLQKDIFKIVTKLIECTRFAGIYIIFDIYPDKEIEGREVQGSRRPLDRTTPFDDTSLELSVKVVANCYSVVGRRAALLKVDDTGLSLCSACKCIVRLLLSHFHFFPRLFPAFSVVNFFFFKSSLLFLRTHQIAKVCNYFWYTLYKNKK